MNKRERILAALAGRPVDRAPASTWRHFVDREQNAADLSSAMLEYHRAFDWDWMKINPRATYFAEAWGNQYDFTHYISVLPTPIRVTLQATADLAQIRPVDPADGPFGEQLDVTARIKRALDDGALVNQTVFSPLSVLGFLAGGPAGYAIPGLPQSLPFLRRAIQEDPAALEAALDAVAETLAAYAQLTVQAGADGIFFAIVRLARDDALTREEYERFGRPYDLRVLDAVSGAPMNVLHLCGDHVYFDQVADYPVHAISWNSESPGNPSFGEAASMTRAALMGGVAEDTTLPIGSPEDVARAVQAALAGTGGQRTLIAAGCSVNPATPPENLLSLRDAARGWRASDPVQGA